VYVSTAGVCGSTEIDLPPHSENLSVITAQHKNGYSQSKLIAERLVIQKMQNHKGGGWWGVGVSGEGGEDERVRMRRVRG
jgi:hypothetical protein